jgi:SAM-dependent methyltransferase
VVVEGFLWLAGRVPAARKGLWRALFEFFATHFRDVEFWTFMNYGYVPTAGEAPLTLAEADARDRYAIHLYHRVAIGADLRGREVLDVGCGRGGGASYVKRYLDPRRVVGLDLAAAAVAFCRRVHRVPGLEFVHGDAERLPFADESFDAVINVESSFCYPSFERFVAEVRRVLRPRGHFLFADIRLRHEIEPLHRALADSGLTVVARADITRNVADALMVDSDYRASTGRRAAPWWLRRLFDVFLGVAGTRIPNQLRDGRMAYCVYRLDKV